jgi:outer membrane protein assembly factor BamE (lipoprotein component of BamABCDE complex)
MVRLAGALALAAALAGCSAQYRNHGYVPPEEDLANIVVGVDTRDSVAQSIGTPSTRDLIDESGYYYVRSRIKTFAHQQPTVVEREVVAISFDKRGVVSGIDRYGLEHGKFVPLRRETTQTGGSQTSFLKKLLKRLGKFSAGDFIS